MREGRCSGLQHETLQLELLLLVLPFERVAILAELRVVSAGRLDSVGG